MSNYAIFFDYDNQTYRLPTNPEQLKTTSTQAITKYEVLKLGQIAIPTHMELKGYSFECEFPKQANSYVEARGGYKKPDYYLKLFQKWRDDLIPVRFMAGEVIDNYMIDTSAINTLVLIEDVTITEKAGEEGDMYISFKLLEYKPYAVIIVGTGAKAKAVTDANTKSNPKNTGSYVVLSGDSLWTIAKKYYGDGSKFTDIFNANKGIIKNPNLIYPGQKLVIPT